MTIGFLCSMLRSDVPVFVERDKHNTLCTHAEKLVNNNEIVGDFEFMKAGALLIKSLGEIE